MTCSTASGLNILSVSSVIHMPAKEENVRTLAIDVGGTGIKGILLNPRGKPITERERVDTPNPATPDAVLAIMDRIATQVRDFDRVSVGFPGVVKDGATLTA